MTASSIGWVLAPTPSPVDPSKVEAGVVGLLFFVVLGVVLVALVFSMRKHLSRIDVNRHARRADPEPGAGNPVASDPP